MSRLGSEGYEFGILGLRALGMGVEAAKSKVGGFLVAHSGCQNILNPPAQLCGASYGSIAVERLYKVQACARKGKEFGYSGSCHDP